MGRKAISKRIRFEVFKRDSFTCQYCGKSAPEIILHIDHIQPVARGGADDIVNLITSCCDCNLGKGARLLSDKSAVSKQKKQLKDLQEKKEQLEMMVAWHKDLSSLNTQTVQIISDYWSDKLNGYYSLIQSGIKEIGVLVKKFSVKEILEAIDSACDKIKFEDDSDQPTKESAEEAYHMIAKICAVNRRSQEKPYLKDLFYIRGILKNRMYVNPWQAMQILENAHGDGVDIEVMKTIAKTARNWSAWQTEMEESAKHYREVR